MSLVAGLFYRAQAVEKSAASVSVATHLARDHMVARRVRHTLNLDHFGPVATAVDGVAGSSYPDNIVFDITPTASGGLLNPTGTLSQSASGFGHPTCLNPPDLATLPVVQHP